MAQQLQLRVKKLRFDEPRFIDFTPLVPNIKAGYKVYKPTLNH